jgi:hypothetical protein
MKVRTKSNTSQLFLISSYRSGGKVDNLMINPLNQDLLFRETGEGN